jgi:hypothetical protein
MFSDTYTNVAVDTWRTSWSQATWRYRISGNKTKKYSVWLVSYYYNTNQPSANLPHWYFYADFTEFKVVVILVQMVFLRHDKEHEKLLLIQRKKMGEFRYSVKRFHGLTTRSHIAQLIFCRAPCIQLFMLIMFSLQSSRICNSSTNSNSKPPQKWFLCLDDAYTNVPVNTWEHHGQVLL